MRLGPLLQAAAAALLVLGAVGTGAAQPSAPAAPEARVHEAAVAVLAEQFPEAADRLAPRVLRVAADVPEGGRVRLAIPAAGVPRGHTRADVFTDEGRAGWALLYVARFDSVVVARHALSRGDTLSADALEVAWLETTRFHGDPALPSAFQGTRVPTVRRSVRAGEALRLGDLVWPAAVGTGDPVRVHYRRHGLLLTLDGTAREPGSVGDAVRVHSRATGAIYRVRLTGPGEAEWLETL